MMRTAISPLRQFTATSLAAIVLSFSPAVTAFAGEPTRIIFDTDIDSDCDDAAALAMLHACADRGEAEILATPVSSKHAWSVACTDAINTWYGRPDLPIGRPTGDGPIDVGSKYARRIAADFPHDAPPLAEIPDAADIYRKVLAAQPDAGVVIVTVGDLTNLRYLIESPADDVSPLSGKELVAKKVRRWVCMGSRYPADLDPKRWGNFKMDPESSVIAVRDWPGEIVFTGGGEFAESLATGAGLAALPDDHPVRRVYELYFDGVAKSRHSADQIAVLVAVRGTGSPWRRVTEGHNHLFPNGTHEWRTAPDDPLHSYISALAPDVKPADVAKMMEELMTAKSGLKSNVSSVK